MENNYVVDKDLMDVDSYVSSNELNYRNVESNNLNV